MKTVDTRGKSCPAPLIATRKALKESAAGEELEIITDNRTAFSNISRYLRENGIRFSFVYNNDQWTIIINEGNQNKDPRSSDEYCSIEIPHFEKGNFIVTFTSDTTGEGSEELGKLLTINFVKALKELDHLPSKILFYNGGVKLCTKDSPVFSDLKMIEEMGVQLLVCGTCIDFYSLNGQMGVGTVSNMFEIVGSMASSANIIKP
jgi:selenium metabolism protein YedF